MGKRNLESAISKCPQYEISVLWRPYLLRPDNPREGVEKPPNTPDNPRVGARMKQAGLQVGIDFTGKCDRSPNTIFAHCVLSYILEKHGSEAQNKVQEALFNAYFTDGVYPDIENLCTIVAGVDIPSSGSDGVGGSGVDIVELRRVLESAEREKDVVKEAAQNARMRTGVPLFFMNGKPMFSGAQPPDSFLEAFEEC